MQQHGWISRHNAMGGGEVNAEDHSLIPFLRHSRRCRTVEIESSGSGSGEMGDDGMQSAEGNFGGRWNKS